MSYIHPVPDWRVTLDGRDLTPAMRPRLISLTLTDKRGGEADQLDIVLDDSDGLLAIPPEGATLTLQLGWKAGSAVTSGLVDKGKYTVEEVEHSGPPDQIIIRARSADIASPLRVRREKSWHDTTIGAIVRAIASRNGLTARVSATLASIPVKSLHQSRESDMALLRRLGREHDATATIKAKTLIFAPTGDAATAGGQPIPALTIRRSDGDRHSWTRAKREDHAGVVASWHDRKGAKKKDVTVGQADGARRLSRTYPSEAAARAAATAEQRRLKREPLKLSLELALGRADLYPDRPMTVAGFKAAIDETSWLVTEVTHSLSDRGFSTSFQLESRN